MMKVVGEEGTSLEDYLLYLKGDLLDDVYLQQNSFDEIDGRCSIERQKLVFNILFKILAGRYKLNSKREARSFIHDLRQKFIDWNSFAAEDPSFVKHQQEVEELFKEKFVEFERQAAKLVEI